MNLIKLFGVDENRPSIKEGRGGVGYGEGLNGFKKNALYPFGLF